MNRILSTSLSISTWTKKDDYIAEKEWRIMLLKKNHNNNLLDFNFAKAIYLGININQRNKTRLMNIAKEQGLEVYQREKKEIGYGKKYTRIL